MDRAGGRSAIVAAFRLPSALEAIRRDHVSNARLGVPAHVTLLFPFVAAASIDDAVVAAAGSSLARTAPFDVEFRDVASFDPGPTFEGAVWLRPLPPEPFVRMTEALAEAFPGYEPYEGIHDEVIPHLTLADVAVDVVELQTAAKPHLPFRRRLNAASLLVEDDEGRWRTAHRLALG